MAGSGGSTKPPADGGGYGQSMEGFTTSQRRALGGGEIYVYTSQTTGKEYTFGKEWVTPEMLGAELASIRASDADLARRRAAEKASNDARMKAVNVRYDRKRESDQAYRRIKELESTIRGKRKTNPERVRVQTEIDRLWKSVLL